MGGRGVSRKSRKMSSFGQPGEERFFVRSFRAAYSEGTVVREHRHDWHQLVFATHGSLDVRTPACTWLVPARRAVWVPSATLHGITIAPGTMVQTIYVTDRLRRKLPAACAALNVGELLRALIVEIAEIGMLDRRVPEHRRLGGVLLDQLQRAQTLDLQLPLPRDARGAAVAQAVLGDPAEPGGLALLAERAGTSERTMARVFAEETGMPFARWRMQARFLEALRRLDSGAAVGEVSVQVGYESPSAFIAAFKRVFGTTPARYAASRREK